MASCPTKDMSSPRVIPESKSAVIRREEVDHRRHYGWWHRAPLSIHGGPLRENPAKSETFSGLYVKSHDQLKGAVRE